MQIDIQEELRRFLADDPTINDEARVVYLLAWLFIFLDTLFAHRPARDIGKLANQKALAD